MKKRNLLLMVMVAMALVFVAGCSSAPKEDEIKDDLISCGDDQLLRDGETLDSIEITDRTTDKKNKTDSILCVVTTHKDDISYEKGVQVTYYKYDKDWEIGNISVSDANSWLMKPLKGVDDETITDELVNQRIRVDGQDWDIEASDISKITVDERNSDLENNKDEVSVTITLDSGVEKATGTLTADFEFDKSWELVSCKANDDFEVVVNETKALNMTEDDLTGLLANETFTLRDSHTTDQEVTVTRDQISDFKINSQNVINKGKNQKYECSCTFTKVNTVCDVQFTVEHTSANETGWNSVVSSKKIQVKSVDWAGKWIGRYLAVPYAGDAVLELNVNGNQVTGTYTYTPDVLNQFSEAGSYNVSGTIEENSLTLRLAAGDWINKPSKIKEWSSTKQDVIVSINLNENQMEGSGHDCNSIALNR